MHGRQQYQAAATTTAGPAQLVLMLYDGALARLTTAIEALDAEPRDVMGAHHAIVKAQAIVDELLVSLDHDRGGRIAENLASLYLYCRELLVEANISKDPALLEDVEDVLVPLRDAWDEANVRGPAQAAG